VQGADICILRTELCRNVVRKFACASRKYAWHKKFGDLEVSDTKRLRSVESERARLKKLLAERDLEIEVMKEIAANTAYIATRRCALLDAGALNRVRRRDGRPT
jgi:hypothetical protein